MMTKCMVALLIGLACVASCLIVSSVSAQDNEDCGSRQWWDPKCRQCCGNKKMVGVPHPNYPNTCKCIPAEGAAKYASKHAIDLLETKKEKAVCDKLKSKSEECKFCCQQRLREPKSSAGSLITGKCNCVKDFVVKYRSDGSSYVASKGISGAMGGGGISTGMMAVSMGGM